MTLRDYLRIPYLLESYSLEHAPGAWTRHVSYPELPDCAAQAPELEDAIEGLERTRLRNILRMLRDGTPPPVARRPLRDCDPLVLSRELGLAEEIAPYLDLDETVLRGATGTAATGEKDALA